MNGEFLDLANARLPVDDRAILFGESVFETVRAYSGRPFRLERHLSRLADAVRLFRIDIPCSAEDIIGAVYLLLEQNGLDGAGRQARVRITVTGGQSEGVKGLNKKGPAGLFILARPYEPPSEEAYRNGVTLAVSGIKRNTSSHLSSVKSGNYMDSVFARQEALDRGDDDAVMLTTAGNLSEATSSNLFMVKGGEVLTPNLGCAFLPGVTREAVLELCAQAGTPCKPVMESLETLMGADEVFLTNSMFELMPVRRVGTRVVPSCPGPVTLTLHEAYRGLVAQETAP